MKVKEIQKYLSYADPELDLIVLTREQYENALKKCEILNDLCKKLASLSDSFKSYKGYLSSEKILKFY